MVCVSHEGETAMTMEAEQWFGGDVWLVTGKPASPLAERADEVIVCTPEIERSWCHTASYTCAVAAIAALNGEDMAWLPDAVEEALGLEVAAPEQEKIVVAGAGRDWPTAQEAVLKLREGAHVPAEAHHLEQLLHGHLAAIDSSVRVVRPRRAGSGRRAGAGRGRGAREARLRDDARPTRASRGRHRPVPPADARHRRGAWNRPGPDPPGAGVALGRGGRRGVPVLDARERFEQAVDLVGGVVVHDPDPDRAVA